MVTLVLPAAALLLGQLPLTAGDLTSLEAAPDFDPTVFGIFAFGPAPIVSAAILVELLALVLPRWRRWRHEGYPGRSRLWTRVWVATVLLAAVQSFFLLRFRTSLGLTHARGLVFLVPILGPLLLLWLAEMIDRYGTGRGLSVLIAAFSLDPLFQGTIPDVVAAFEGMDRVLGPLLLAAMLLVAVVISVGHRPTQGWIHQPPRPQLLTPASGIPPLAVTIGLVYLPVSLRPFVQLEDQFPFLTPGTPINLVLAAVLLIGVTSACVGLFNRPRRVAELWRRGPGALDPETARAAAVSAWRRGYGRSVAMMLALGGAVTLASQAGVTLSWLALVVLGCVSLDVAGELRFRRAHGPVTAVWPLHRSYAVGPALARMQEAGIPAYPRCLRHGALLSFFGPHVPVELLVPEPQAEQAQELLRALLLPEPPRS